MPHQPMTPDPGGSKKRIFLVDDHPLVREWLTNLINQQPDLCVCGEAEAAPEALQSILASKPDIGNIIKRAKGLKQN